MAENEGRITIHMAASLDGYIAREDGSVDWMETEDEYAAGEELDADYVSRFLEGIDCYLMGSGTYLTALDFEKRGLGWAYGDKPVLVLTSRALERSRESVTFHGEDLRGIASAGKQSLSQRHGRAALCGRALIRRRSFFRLRIRHGCGRPIWRAAARRRPSLQDGPRRNAPAGWRHQSTR